MKQNEFKRCILCGEGMMHNRDIQFYTVAVKTFIIDLRAVQRQAGLEMYFGGGAAGGSLAAAMGTNEDLAKQASDSGDMFVCTQCMLEHGLGALHMTEMAEERGADAPERSGGRCRASWLDTGG